MSQAMPQKHVIIIGAGFAGLSAATTLVMRGFRVTVLEGRQVLGGRAYSFKDTQMGDAVDNGQHLFMGCYRETQAFLERIGALDRLIFQPNLSVDFLGDGNRRGKLSCLPLPSPWHLLSGLLRLNTLSWPDRLRLRHLEKALKHALAHPGSLERVTVEEWLKSCHQSERARRDLWDLIAIATLNEDPAVASAEPFAVVLGQAFFDRRKASRLGLAGVGLSDLYAKSAREFIEKFGGEVRTKSPVGTLNVQGGRVTGVTLRDGTVLTADWVISAVNASAFLRMIPPALQSAYPSFQKVAKLTFAPIISMHLWFDREISKSAFVGMLDTQIQWFFNKSEILGKKDRPGYVSLTISGAHRFIDWTDKALITLALEELRRLFPAARDAVLHRSLVIKEHQATLSPTVGSEALRPAYESPLTNFLIAGDWTRTGLPATIESACVSGHACANIVIRREMEAPTDRPEVAYA
jgi:squalene-associated FAD-dependent desaturase